MPNSSFPCWIFFSLSHSCSVVEVIWSIVLFCNTLITKKNPLNKPGPSELTFLISLSKVTSYRGNSTFTFTLFHFVMDIIQRKCCESIIFVGDQLSWFSKPQNLFPTNKRFPLLYTENIKLRIQEFTKLCLFPNSRKLVSNELKYYHSIV